jgi:hypothetical protein
LKLVLALVLGWGLGLATATVRPDLTVERRSVVVNDRETREQVQLSTAYGWRVVAVEGGVVYQLERPRFPPRLSN